MDKTKEIETGEFGPIYRQFEKKPKEAIKFLRKMKDGECIAALHRNDIGDIDIVWGKVNNKKTEVISGLICSSLSKTSTLTVFVTCAVW